MSKQKPLDSNRSRSAGKERTLTVAEGSQQPRAPGWVAPGSANVQSANIEQLGAALRARGSLQGGMDNLNAGSQRGGAGSQQSGWSARQNGQRLRERGEEDRLNASRQSGQDQAGQQVAGAQDAVSGPAGSMQGAAGASRRQDVAQQPSSRGGKRSKKS